MMTYVLLSSVFCVLSQFSSAAVVPEKTHETHAHTTELEEVGGCKVKFDMIDEGRCGFFSCYKRQIQCDYSEPRYKVLAETKSVCKRVNKYPRMTQEAKNFAKAYTKCVATPVLTVYDEFQSLFNITKPMSDGLCQFAGWLFEQNVVANQGKQCFKNAGGCDLLALGESQYDSLQQMFDIQSIVEAFELINHKCKKHNIESFLNWLSDHNTKNM